MAQTSAGPGPIPPAKKDDSEDVAWALSTAEAMFARGDRGDALKWLRRAAEAASEAQADDRALELAKAAADLASAIGPTTSVPPPPGPPPQVSASRPPPPLAAPPPGPQVSSRPPPGPPPARSAAPPPAPALAPTPAPTHAPAPAPTHAPGPAHAPPPPPSRPSPARGAAKGTPPAKPHHPKPPEREATLTGIGAKPSEPRRRRSRPDIILSRPADEVTESMSAGAIPAPHPPEPRRRGRGSKPAAEEVTPPAAVAAVPFDNPTPFPDRETVPADVPQIPGGLQTDEMDAWPTQSLAGDDLADPADEKTRIGVPAYEASAKLATEAPVVVPARVESRADPALRPSQALRVVVWRAADGVHVAPHGTRVAAITVDAVLVSLDPSADLAAWLSGK